MDLFIYLNWIYLLPIRKIKYTAKWEFQDKSRESDKYGLIIIDDKKKKCCEKIFAPHTPTQLKILCSCG